MCYFGTDTACNLKSTTVTTMHTRNCFFLPATDSARPVFNQLNINKQNLIINKRKVMIV